MGANLLQVSRWLGHSTVEITADVYGHLFHETNDLVIGRLDKALRGALPRPADVTRTIDGPDAHGSDGLVPARSRHAAPRALAQPGRKWQEP
jgi:hypothetical protein